MKESKKLHASVFDGQSMPQTILAIESDPRELQRLAIKGRVYLEDAQAIAELAKVDPAGAEKRWRDYVVTPWMRQRKQAPSPEHDALDARDAVLLVGPDGVLTGWRIGPFECGIAFEGRALCETTAEAPAEA